MISVEIHGLWRGRSISDSACVTKLADDLEDQQKQVTALALQKISTDSLPAIEPNERAADYARRAGFTQLDYHYQCDNTWMTVDILEVGIGSHLHTARH